MSTKSSVIKAFKQEGKNLVVELVNGKTYTYKDVPAEVAKAFEKAESWGSYYNCNIKNKYELV